MNELVLFDILNERYGRVSDWFECILARTNYRTGIADWVTEGDHDRMTSAEDDAAGKGDGDTD